jgi:hypothetical protein
MRTSCLRVGLLSVAIAFAPLIGAAAQQDDKSYLPPPSLRAKADTAAKRPVQTGTLQPQRAREGYTRTQEGYARKRVRVARVRRYERHRYASSQPAIYFQRFFGIFN